MIRKLLALGLSSGMALSLSAQTAFTVKGSVKDNSRDGEKLTISYFDGVKKVYKSAVIQNGSYTFEGTVMEPSKAILSIPKTLEAKKLNPWNQTEKVEFFIEGGLVTVENMPPNVKVKAPGKSQQELLKLQKTIKPLQQKEESVWLALLDATTKKDSVNKAQYDIQHKKIQKQIDSLEYVFLQKNPGSHVSLGILREKVTTPSLAADREKFAALLKPLADSLKQTIVGKQLCTQIANAFKLAPGQDAIDFVLNDTLGRPVHLSSFRGKYVLLDFWASWCIPCRFENPTVKKAYERFKNKNFTVLSVSLERPGDRQAWVDAIIKDGLPWNHVAALTKEEGENMWKMYNIQSIPMNYLIDPNGKIVAVYLRGEALEKKLKEIL